MHRWRARFVAAGGKLLGCLSVLSKLPEPATFKLSSLLLAFLFGSYSKVLTSYIKNVNFNE